MASVSIKLLVENEQLVRPIAEMRWREWGEPTHKGKSGLDGHVEITRAEAGRDELPITWVAVDESGNVVGAAALLPESDFPGRPEFRPALGGLIVDPQQRRMGVGARLVGAIEQWARHRGISQVWVVTGGEAVGFYRNCGWVVAEEAVITWPNVNIQESVSILTRSL